MMTHRGHCRRSRPFESFSVVARHSALRIILPGRITLKLRKRSIFTL